MRKSAVTVALGAPTTQTRGENPGVKTWGKCMFRASRFDGMACASLAGPSTGISTAEETLGRSHRGLSHRPFFLARRGPPVPCLRSGSGKRGLAVSAQA